ncbi:TetR/AcrR family transcriptional regulator [Agrobacterium rosae]|uniref:TetR/AcrR family transcriptional regulator n=1 Tax=Agrobacterium rosae TaxID=1972867 RepID=A0AAW9FKZ3_9HYPH|nr:TetR/AcrR family transcriptional regulator [Agrobacterium rosae]MDX8305821.1 TetR/AcrR family transcriptional regulator [Agrobacterium rosae]
MDEHADPKLNRKAGIRAENEALIIKAAEEIFATYGYRGASISVIAQKAGVPKANIYHYFDTKEDLYRHVLKRTHKSWEEAADALTDIIEPVEALTAYIHRKMDISRERYFASKVFATEVMQGAPMLGDYIESEIKPWTEREVERIRKWISSGALREIEPIYLLMMIWATTQNYADFEHQIRILNGGKPLSDSQFACAKDTVTTIILRGVTVPK